MLPDGRTEQRFDGVSEGRGERVADFEPTMGPSAVASVPSTRDRATFRSAGLLNQRARVGTSFRLTTRLYAATSGLVTGRRSGLQGAAAAASATGDVTLGRLLDRDHRFHFGARLAADAVDTALWSLAYPDGYDAAVLNGVPLALEAGIRLDLLRAIAVPTVSAATTLVIRKLRHRPFRLAPFWWQVAGLGAGLGISAYNTRRLRSIEARSAREMEAAEQSAWLAGQNDVAMGANSIIDELCHASNPLRFSPTTDGSAGIGRILAEWKASLATTTANKAIYLQTALQQWQNRNNLHPDLASLVQFELLEGDGTMVLDGAQAAELAAELDLVRPVGRVPVVLVDGSNSRDFNAPIRLIVGNAEIILQTRSAHQVRPLDPGPGTLLMTAVWFASSALHGGGAVPVHRALPQTAAAVLAAGWATRRVGQVGDAAHPEILAAQVGLATLHTLMASRAVRVPFASEGIRRFPATDGLYGLLILTSTFWDDLNLDQRRMLAGAVAGVSLLGLLITPRPRSHLHWCVEMAWPLLAFTSSRGFRAALAEDADIQRTELDALASARTTAAYRKGRHDVLALVQKGRDSLRERLAASEHLDLDVQSVVAHRIDQIDHRLEHLQFQPV